MLVERVRYGSPFAGAKRICYNGRCGSCMLVWGWGYCLGATEVDGGMPRGVSAHRVYGTYRTGTRSGACGHEMRWGQPSVLRLGRQPCAATCT